MQFNVRTSNYRRAPPCWRGASRQRDPALVPQGASLCSFFVRLHPLFLHTPLCSTEKKDGAKHREEATQRHFYLAFCWLSWTPSPRGWWGGMALWRNQPGASIVVIIIWKQDCWICSFGPLHGWEMTCLCLPDTLSVYSEAAQPVSASTQPSSTLSAQVDKLFFFFM